MKLLCQNNITKVYDDGKNYRVVTRGSKDSFIDKKKQKQYPLACVLKWGMQPVDIEYLNNLSEYHKR